MDAFSVKLLACLCAWLPLSTCGPIYNWEGASEDEGRYLPEDDYQENEAVDFNSLLEHMKGQFLKSLNLSGNRPPPQATAAGAEPPEYMVDLYNKFANDKTSMPSANIVRSFRNEDMSPVPNQTSRIRRHSLLFNVSIPHHEEITMAELRLYTLVDANRRIYEGVDRKVTVYESPEGEGDRGTGKVGPEQGKLAWRQTHGANSGWETFDVTQAVLRWSRLEESTHRLLVHIESTEGEEHQPRSPGVGMGLDSQHVPLLIIYSDDRNSVRKEAIEELEEIISHEKDVAFEGLDVGSLGLFPDEGSLLQRRSNMLYDTSSRTRRNAKRNYCKRSPLYVEFKEIGWDSWIIAPTGYEAYECKGLCYYPLTNEVTPTQHAIVQTLVNHHNPKVAAKACCVPTKLDPISILYLDEAGVVTYKFKYEGMMVAECGCR